MNATDALFQSVRAKDATRVAELVATDATLLDARDDRGSTALVLATYLDDLPTTRALVGAGAPVNAQDAAGNTALMGVCFRGHADIARYLLEQGASASVTNHSGATALTFAATFNQPLMVDLLLAAGADAAHRDARGLSPADHARGQGHQALADRLDQ